MIDANNKLQRSLVVRVFYFIQSLSKRNYLLGPTDGMTMVELMVVVALIAFIYSIAVPQFSMRTGTEVATKTQRLADDIRSAFDMAVLNNRTYRIAFQLSSGKYHLESADRLAMLDSSSTGKDPTEEEAKAKQEEFAAQTKDLESLAGEPIKDEKGNPIEGSNLSPILKYRGNAAPTKWTVVENLEWSERSLGDFLLISEMQAEHHTERQTIADLGPSGRAFLYFYPQGYVERAFIRVAYKRDEGVPDENEKPYTIITKPFIGSADVVTGNVEMNFKDDAGEGDE